MVPYSPRHCNISLVGHIIVSKNRECSSSKKVHLFIVIIKLSQNMNKAEVFMIQCCFHVGRVSQTNTAKSIGSFCFDNVLSCLHHVSDQKFQAPFSGNSILILDMRSEAKAETQCT